MDLWYRAVLVLAARVLPESLRKVPEVLLDHLHEVLTESHDERSEEHYKELDGSERADGLVYSRSRWVRAS